MSTIEKMTISGIRNFGCEKNDKQEISFKPPLTLILGANGCGKTTIIECLKYAITGEFPPGTNRGQSFVNDPKIAKSVESLGQVKLRIRNLKGHKVTISRSMKSYFKNHQLKFESISPSIVVVDDKGNEVQLTNRCIDVTTEMCTALGVSKAIINNVIFCHQDDSDWPLDEAKKLKEKFDAIFGTTQYNKAIDKIIKLIKNYQEQHKHKEIELGGLLVVKTETEKKQLKLNNAKSDYEKSKEKVNDCEKELQPIKDRLIKIQELEYNISKLNAEKIALQTTLKNYKEQQENLKRKIKNIFDGDLMMLDQEISTFESNMEQKRNELEKLNKELNISKNNELKLQSTLSDLEKKRTTLSFQRQQEQDLISERAEKVNELYKKLNIGSASIDSQNINDLSFDIFDEIRNALKNEENTVSQLSKAHDESEQSLQKNIDKIREKKITIETDIESNNVQIQNLETERKNLEKEINSCEKSALKLKFLSEKITTLNTKYEALLQTSSISEMKENIVKRKENRDKLQEKLDKLDDEIKYLNSISSIRSEISMKEKLLEERESEMKRIKNKHSDNLKKLFPTKTLENNFKRNINTLQQNLQREIKDLNNKVHKLQLEITKQNTIRSSSMDEIKKFENELRELEEKIYEQCSGQDYEDVLNKLKCNIDKAQLEYGSSKSAEVLYKCYINKLENDPCCPLCHEGMTDFKVKKLSDELTDEIRRLPEKIDQSDKQLKLYKKKYDKLLTLRQSIERVEFLKKEIPIRKEKFEKIKETITNTLNDSESLQMAIIEPEDNLRTIESITGDMTLLDEAMKDIVRLKEELESIKQKLPTSSKTSTMDLDEAQLEKSAIAAEIKNERLEIERLQKKVDDDSEKLNSIREIRIGLKDEQIKLQERVQSLSQSTALVEDIQKKIEMLIIAKHNLETKLLPLQDELNEALENKERIRRENREKLNNAQSKLNDKKQKNQDIIKLNEQLEELSKLNIEKEIEYVKSSIIKYKVEFKQKNIKTEEISIQIELLKEELTSQNLKSRELLDNRELKKLEKNAHDLEIKYNKLSSDIGDADFRRISKEKSQLLDKQEEMNCLRSEYIGTQNELKRQIHVIEKELEQDMYKNSLKYYREALHELEAFKCILHDLKEYRAAFEWAILKFHSEKMQKINRLIREYWRSIYRGNDIDYIEIKTDENTGNDFSKKRAYNYRVVQSKNNIELDMRGRCSAGQKVLACLIIRMALAETFSSNCGILALDEPTTNLDRSNVHSLCEELKRIIEERQSESNFLLIVITHDEEFLKAMGNINSFYKVFRNHAGKSMIEKEYVN